PMKRSSAPAAATTRLVEPTSLTTHCSPAAVRAAAIVSGRAAIGVAANTTSAPPTASATLAASASIAPSDRAWATTAGAASYPVTGAPARSRAASPIEPPISPTPRTATRIRSARRPLRRAGFAIADGGGQALEHLDGGRPADARVGDRLAVAKLGLGSRL